MNRIAIVDDSDINLTLLSALVGRSRYAEKTLSTFARFIV